MRSMKIELIKQKNGNKLIVENKGQFSIISNISDNIVEEIENIITKLIKDEFSKKV